MPAPVFMILRAHDMRPYGHNRTTVGVDTIRPPREENTLNARKPLLSIGIIFKNDIRCIERCLKALQPLRDAMPCELVMADTGSTDGSRAVAEKYADIVFDFPWIDDFAAARNAVMNRCSGAWHLAVDTDEYLNGEVSELVEFLASPASQTSQLGSVIVRNYGSYEMDGNYLDFVAIRMVKMSTGARYSGEIHEQLVGLPEQTLTTHFYKMVFDHDGYVGLGDKEKGKAKRERNLKLIRKRLEANPENLLLHMQLLESSGHEADYVEQLRQAIALLEQKVPGWENIGPPLIRYAIYEARGRNLPEVEQWVQLAEAWYPESVFIRIDVEYNCFIASWGNQDYEDCVRRGERYLLAMEKYHAGAYIQQMLFGVLQMANPYQEQAAKIALASACCQTGRISRAFELLAGLDSTLFDLKQTSDSLITLQEVHYRSDYDTASVLLAFWEGCRQSRPSQAQTEQREAIFFATADTAFVPKNQTDEQKKKSFQRFGYTLYLPLRGKCELGTAAAVLQMEDPDAIKTALLEVLNWSRFPIYALVHALECGASFPLPGSSLQSEEMDALAGRLTQSGNRFFPLVLQAAADGFSKGHQETCWVRGLTIAAIRVFDWKGEAADTEKGMLLARAYSQVEKAYLPVCYAQGILNRENLFILPPLHRFGFYCAQAFDALDAGDAAGYVRLLREGLTVCEGAKDMVEFLLNSTPELKDPSDELKAMAEQIRALLANFAPDDPAVAALKQSEAYRKVAYLIEGLDVPVTGGLMQ